MKYRIKIITYKNGRKEYIPQVKMFIGWAKLCYDGEADYLIQAKCDSREDALKRIDKHFEGNSKTQTIEFEYIKK